MELARVSELDHKAEDNYSLLIQDYVKKQK